MGGLVEDLLALARLDEAKPLDLAEVDLVPLARDAALDAMAANPLRTVTVIAPEHIPRDAAGATPAEVELDLDSTPARSASTPMSFAGATLARLRGRRTATEGGSARARRGSGSRGSAAASAATGSTATQTAVAPTRPSRELAPTTTSNTVPVRRAVVLAEENKIRQVITNLMGNAMRFTPEDTPIEIRVSLDEVAERAVLEIVDHGEGIPPQIREKIFQRFWRADTSRARETGGSGLGLAIVSSIVSAHNGHVDVVETPGGGATFRVALPLASSAAAPQSFRED